MSSFFIAESNNRFEMYEYKLPRWVDISKTAKSNKRIFFSSVAFIIILIFSIACFDYLSEEIKGLFLSMIF